MKTQDVKFAINISGYFSCSNLYGYAICAIIAYFLFAFLTSCTAGFCSNRRWKCMAEITISHDLICDPSHQYCSNVTFHISFNERLLI